MLSIMKPRLDYLRKVLIQWKWHPSQDMKIMDAKTLCPFKRERSGGEAGLATVDYNVPVAIVRDNTQLCTYLFSPFTPTY